VDNSFGIVPEGGFRGVWGATRSNPMKKFAVAMFVCVAAVGFVMADEFGATINKVETADGKTKVTFTKKGKKGAKGEEMTVLVGKDAKILTGKFNADTKKVEDGDAIDKGLKADMFVKIDEKGVGARITTSEDGGKGEITKIVVFQKKKAAN
jgi:hypothetical protein